MIACLKNEDALSPFLRRNPSKLGTACLHFCDILVHQGVVVSCAADATKRKLLTNTQSGLTDWRPSDGQTGGQAACLSLSIREQTVFFSSVRQAGDRR